LPESGSSGMQIEQQTRGCVGAAPLVRAPRLERAQDGRRARRPRAPFGARLTRGPSGLAGTATSWRGGGRRGSARGAREFDHAAGPSIARIGRTGLGITPPSSARSLSPGTRVGGCTRLCRARPLGPSVRRSTGLQCRGHGSPPAVVYCPPGVVGGAVIGDCRKGNDWNDVVDSLPI
jgi:hypothetical protein